MGYQCHNYIICSPLNYIHILILCIQVIDVLVSAAPYYNPVVGKYGWSRRVGGCSPLFNGYRLYVLLQSLHSLIPLTIIVITSCWTFMFTRGFLRRHLKRQKSVLNGTSFEEQKHVYSSQVKNLIGIFGSLLLFNFISWTPFLGISAAGFGIGFHRLPNAVYASGYVLFLFSNVFNPIIQMYFRKDLIDSFKRFFCKWRMGKKELSCMKWCRRDEYPSESSDESKPRNVVQARSVKLKENSNTLGFESVITVLEDSISINNRLDDLEPIEKNERFSFESENILEGGDKIEAAKEDSTIENFINSAKDSMPTMIEMINAENIVSNGSVQDEIQFEMQQI